MAGMLAPDPHRGARGLMADIVVCGGSVIGLSTAMMLARDGHDVTVLERDPAPVPDSWDEAWSSWDRPGVPQLRQPHNLFPRYRQILEAELPDVFDGLVDNGGTWVNFVANLPPFITDREPRPDDDQFGYVTGRRPMVEYVHAAPPRTTRASPCDAASKVRGFATGPEQRTASRRSSASRPTTACCAPTSWSTRWDVAPPRPTGSARSARGRRVVAVAGQRVHVLHAVLLGRRSRRRWRRRSSRSGRSCS